MEFKYDLTRIYTKKIRML